MFVPQEDFSLKPIYICPAGMNINQTFTVNKGKYLVFIYFLSYQRADFETDVKALQQLLQIFS